MDTDRQSCGCFYNVTGEKAQEILLKYGKHGDFLVRPSESNKSDHTLSVHRGDRITHVKIPMRDGQYVLPNGQLFDGLKALVDLITEESVIAEADGTVIETKTLFDMRTSRFTAALVGCDSFFHPKITGVDAAERLKQEPHGTFLLRESSTTPGEFVITVKCDDDVLHIKVYNDCDSYKVGPQIEAFRTVGDLVRNYMNTPMEHANGKPIPLLTPLPSTMFLPALIDERIELLQKPLPRNTSKRRISEEFEVLQNDPDARLFISCREGRRPENQARNRYRNIIPFDHTRVVLQPEENGSCQSDYINANYVEVIHDGQYTVLAGVDKRYISTQGCLESTVGSFWRMVMQEKTSTIVMLTREQEKSKSKCFQYWPSIKEKIYTGFNNEIAVESIEEAVSEEIIRRVFVLSHRGEQRVIRHFQFLFWDDYECPAACVRTYMEEVNVANANAAGPMVVHCSAGIGRTGTYIVIDLIVEHIRLFGLTTPIDIFQTVRMLRGQRQNMVQTETQYSFIYEAVAAYVHYLRSQTTQTPSVPSSPFLPRSSGAPPPLTSPLMPEFTARLPESIANKLTLSCPPLPQRRQHQHRSSPRDLGNGAQDYMNNQY